MPHGEKGSSMISLRHLLLIATVFTVGIVAVHADTLHVASIAEPGGDGRSWGTAYRYLTSALDAWQPGDEIWVAEGTYRADEGPGRTRGDRTASFMIKNGMRIFGGFPNGEPLREKRDWFRRPSILTGDLNGNDGDARMADDPRRAENTRHVLDLRAQALDSTTIINGLTIVHGNADIDGGGGAIVGTGTPRFRNCRFLNNASASVGGGLHAVNVRRMHLNYCVFEGNWAVQGGGAYIDHDSMAVGFGAYITESFFVNNIARERGGAIVFDRHQTPQVSSSVFVGNQVTGAGAAGGAVYATRRSQPYIVNCTFSRNLYANIGGEGAAVAMHAGQVLNSIFWGDDVAEIRQIAQLDTVGLGARIVPTANLVRNDWDFGFYQSDPQFVDIDNPAGRDKVYGTDDDGLYLTTLSPAMNAGFIDKYVNHHHTDIVGNPRLVGRKAELGAYETQRIDRLGFRETMTELRTGKAVLLYRHAKTDWGQRDPGPSPECFPGRNLIFEGREQSTEMGLHQRALGLTAGDVITSPACRCWETVFLMWGRYEKQPRWAGGQTTGGPVSSSAQRWKDLDSIPTNGIRVISSHDGVCQQMYNPNGDGEIVTTAEFMEGDCLIIRPLGDTNQVLAQWNSETWQRYHIRFPEGAVSVQDEVPPSEQHASIAIAPNPSSAYARVRVSAQDTYIVVDAIGRTVMTLDLHGVQTIDISSLAVGNYVMRGMRSGATAVFAVAR
jgi:phosphohistidine phosphatase SixA